ncbi:DUF5085 family protein [Fictibacillus sp. WQ 8-8]|uniref:DUF5085 family protein n=1 Tax=unclassified Fictibacillus TaxID=2644029 RepID=UPI00210C8381|nr:MULTISPECIES: DUF5085 family protein [unclassified Fictibacillus]MCQ6265140.1 DUF5085 family protein [Fictibacillus sp. WQ 8-8]MED2971823.1 DUF5085 family protein [Fictibacillus sp. B-59209]
MIGEDQSIAYSNVVSKEYYFHYSEMERVIEDLLSEIAEVNLTIKGPLFYALKNIPKDENMYIELFMPVQEDKIPSSKSLRFRSYYYVDEMLMKRFTGNYETLTEFVYAELFQYMVDNNLNLASPIYHIFGGDESIQYVDVKISVFSEE